MPFKYDADGNIVTQEVNGQKLPVFVNAGGAETPFDGDGTVANISRLNGEAKSHRERAEKAETTLKAFEGITDPEAAKKALSTVKNWDDKKLVDAGEVEKIKQAAIDSVKAEYEPFVTKSKDLEQQLYGEKIGGAFARSKFIADKVAVPVDMVQATFGSRFKVEDGKTVAHDANGQPIFSRVRHGEPADFEEALEIMVDSYPHKNSILKGSQASGGGAQGGGGGGGGKKTVTRSQFDAMSPLDKAAVGSDANTVITD
jgi:hypothetical protein